MKLSSIKLLALFLAMTFVLFNIACKKDEEIEEEEKVSVLEEGKLRYTELMNDGSFIEVLFPEEDPGPPFYARLYKFPEGALIMTVDDKVFIPFIRQLACVDSEFNLLEFFHVPDAFFCALTVPGKGLIELDAPQGTFPAIAYGEGDNVDMWIVDKSKFDAAIADGVLTIADLEALEPLRGNGTYAEYNVPRPELGQLLLIEASGNIASTNQNFTFTYVERNYQQVSISLDFN